MTNGTTKSRPAATSAMERANVPSTCQCCGREDLQKTVKVTDGTTTLWMGTGCAAKACGMGIKEFGKALKSEQTTQDAADRRAEDEARRAELARWFAFLDGACPAHKGVAFEQIRVLGGINAARAAYKAAA